MSKPKNGCQLFIVPAVVVVLYRTYYYEKQLVLIYTKLRTTILNKEAYNLVSRTARTQQPISVSVSSSAIVGESLAAASIRTSCFFVV